MANQECEHLLLKCEGEHHVMCVRCFSLIDAPRPQYNWVANRLWRCVDCLNIEFYDLRHFIYQGDST